jgi:hypothetical protein
MAIFGQEFCVAGTIIFYLRRRNQSRLSQFEGVLGLILIIGKTMVAFGGALGVYYYLTSMSKPLLFAKVDLSTLAFPFLPPFLIFFFGLFIAQVLKLPMERR